MNSLLIGKTAPAFKAKAVVKGNIVTDFSLSNFLGQYVVFFMKIMVKFVRPIGKSALKR